MNILFTICGRAGSKGFKGKNLKKFHGHPLVHYTLSAIDLFKTKMNVEVDIGINTDSEELKKMTGNYPGVILVNRKPELATDTASKISVIADTYKECENQKNKKYDMIIDLDLTSPIRTVSDIEKLVQKKLESPYYDVIFSVVDSRRNPFFNMVKEDNEYVSLVNESTFTARQQAPTIYDMNASMYLYDPLFLRTQTRIFDGKCGIIKMKDYLVLDIDSEEDFIWMTYLYEKFLEEDEALREIYKHIEEIF